jgi:hypothetical protein
MTKAEVEQLISAALEPLQQEIAELREKLSNLTPQPSLPVGAQHAAPLHENNDTHVAIEQTLSPNQNALILEPSANPERTDFQRFLQRGLEEEQVRYSEEAVADKPAPKKGGWNPFRR